MKQVLVIGSSPAVPIVKEYLLRGQETELEVDTLSENEIPADTDARKLLISRASLIISFLPPALHQQIAQDCIELRTHLVCPAVMNEGILNLRSQVEKNNLLFLYELGVDPGLDHLSALQFIHDIKHQGATILSFQTHVGLLPAQADNPWQYKLVERARNIIDEGKEGAVYKQQNEIKELGYEEVFDNKRLAEVPGIGFLSWYPVRDSLGYIPLYGLESAQTFIRSTLHHPDFIYGWKNVIDLKLTDDALQYASDGLSLADFFKMHFDQQGFNGWLEQKMMERFRQTKQILEKLMKFMEVEQDATEAGEKFPDNLMVIDEKGKLDNIHLDEVKDNAAAMVAYKMHEANLTLKQLFFLGMDDRETLINKGYCSASAVLQRALEKKLSMPPGEADQVVMLHEMEYELNGKRMVSNRYLVLKGNGRDRAADMINGLLSAIAAKLVLTDSIRLRGLHMPIRPEIYIPVMEELGRQGVVFREF
jgi:saccharopine dehydrogenase-like NADP-dependent oxidoreductase